MDVLNAGNRVINNYLIKLMDGYLLIDTGYPEFFDDFSKKLSMHGINFEQIKYIFLTHAHDDHAGYLNQLLDRSDAKIIMHSKAPGRLTQGQNSFAGGCSNLQAWLFCKLMEVIGKGEHRFLPVVRTDRYIILDNITQPRIEEELSASILCLPGHTEDSIGLLLSDGTLFCGDAAMNGFPSTNRITIWIEDLDQYIKSWELMISINPKRIYPAHGKPFGLDDLRRYIKKVKKRKLYPL